MKIFNLNSDEWDGTRYREGWRAKGALVGQAIGGELIGRPCPRSSLAEALA